MRAEAEGPDLDGLLFSIAGRFGRSLAPILQSVSRVPFLSSFLCSVFSCLMIVRPEPRSVRPTLKQ